MARLDGRKLLLTRSAEDSREWADAVTAEGARPIVFPCIRTEPIDDPALTARLATAIARADWLIFTSRRGVAAIADRIGAELPRRVRIAAVGDTTAECLTERFGRVDHIGPGRAAGLGHELAAELGLRRGARCVLALAENAGRALEKTLAAAGATVERFDVYRTVPMGPLKPKRRLSTLGCDTVIFASPSAVTGFDNQVNVDTARLLVTIGPSTSAAVRERHWNVTAEAGEPSLSGIIESVLEAAHA
jgi:uroporphyrinogen-III synthase